MAVYFIQCQVTGRIKIGRSDRPRSRLRQLRSCSPTPLLLLGTLDGGQRLEAELHERFSEARDRFEWFDPVSPLLEFLAEHEMQTRSQTELARTSRDYSRARAILRRIGGRPSEVDRYRDQMAGGTS